MKKNGFRLCLKPTLLSCALLTFLLDAAEAAAVLALGLGADL